MDTISILEKANINSNKIQAEKATEEATKEATKEPDINGFEKFMSMINPFKCVK